jgi:hypothetical protein
MTHAGISGAQGFWSCSENESTGRLQQQSLEIFSLEKRRERPHSRKCRGTQKLVVLCVRVRIGFYSLSLCVLPEGGDAFEMQMGISREEVSP